MPLERFFQVVFKTLVVFKNRIRIRQVIEHQSKQWNSQCNPRDKVADFFYHCESRGQWEDLQLNPLHQHHSFHSATSWRWSIVFLAWYGLCKLWLGWVTGAVEQRRLICPKAEESAGCGFSWPCQRLLCGLKKSYAQRRMTSEVNQWKKEKNLAHGWQMFYRNNDKNVLNGQR